MSLRKTNKRLRKELKLLDVYAIATGTTLSAGFFLLPAIAAQQVGSALIFAYMLAVIPLIPAAFSIIELTTAMPKAGGMYFSLDRAFGPLFGTVGGLGTWLSLIMKVSFALIGMGVYLMIYFPDLAMEPIAVVLALVLGALSLFGVKKGGRLQVYMLIVLLAILIVFFLSGFTYSPSHEIQDFTFKMSPLVSTAGMVYISYVGIAKVASLSEEIKNPDKNLPLGVFLGIFTTIAVYGVGTYIIVKILPMNELTTTLTPVADAAYYLMGDVGVLLVTIAAFLAFLSVANAGTMSASRYPLAMSRDFIMPHGLKKINRFGAPARAIVLTVAIIILSIVLFEPAKIAKLASAFQLVLNALVCIGVIIMRESRIESYDPGFKSPFYPYMQIFGVVISLWFIGQMGVFSILFSVSLIVISVLWYIYYAKDKVERTGAIYHIFERLGRASYKGLDIELRGILKEKGLREDDPFDEIVTKSAVIDIDENMRFRDIVEIASSHLAEVLNMTAKEIREQYNEGTKLGATPVINDVALPHFRTKYTRKARMVIVRAKNGVDIRCETPLISSDTDIHTVHALFFLASPDDNPTQHLRILAQIAGRVDEESFTKEWTNARTELELKEALIHDERFASLIIKKDSKSDVLINSMLREVSTPVGCLVAMLQRSGRTIIPNGNTVLEEGDRVTILGDKKALNEFRNKYVDE